MGGLLLCTMEGVVAVALWLFRNPKRPSRSDRTLLLILVATHQIAIGLFAMRCFAFPRLAVS
jgi:hypothetical protein